MEGGRGSCQDEEGGYPRMDREEGGRTDGRRKNEVGKRMEGGGGRKENGIL